MNWDKIEKILNYEWNVQGFISSLTLIYSPFISGVKMKKYHPYSYSYLVSFFKDDYCEAYYGIKDITNIWNKMEELYQKDNNYLLDMRKKYLSIVESYSPLIQEIVKTDLSKVNLNELIALFKKTDEMAMEYVSIIHNIEAFSIISEKKLREKIMNIIDDKKKTNKYIELLSHPVTKSWSNEAEENLFRISKTTDSKEKERLLKEHEKRFFWIRNNYLQAKALTYSDFEEELKNIRVYQTIDYETIKNQKKELIKELSLDKDTIKLISQIEFFVDLQDIRKRNILKSLYYLEMFCDEISKRAKIPPILAKYVIPSEVSIDFLNKKDLKKILEERRNGCIIISSENEINILVGKEFDKAQNILHKKIKNKEKDIHGLTASSGYAIGEVRIVKDMSSLNKIKEGDILVTTMTRPEFIPAMKKAAAIVTDEGGITCHAAIISREMGKPCIIGTKIATKIFKDGDIIEVKANHGIVRKV